VRWYRASAEQGRVEAQFSLGTLYARHALRDRRRRSARSRQSLSVVQPGRQQCAAWKEPRPVAPAPRARLLLPI
jgi:TPR repeat protein